jgi:hypothetical protein
MSAFANNLSNSFDGLIPLNGPDIGSRNVALPSSLSFQSNLFPSPISLKIEGSHRNELIRIQLSNNTVISDSSILNCDKTFAIQYAYLLYASLQSNLPSNYVSSHFLRCYDRHDRNVESSAQFISDLKQLFTQSKSAGLPLLCVPVLCNDVHWVLLVIRVQQFRVWVVGSINQAKNLSLSEIQLNHFAYFGSALNELNSSAPFQPSDLNMIQMLQHGNMGCGIATFESAFRISARCLRTSMDSLSTELDAMSFQLNDRVMHQRGWTVMALDPQSADVIHAVITDESVFQSIRSNLDHGRRPATIASTFCNSESQSDWEVLDSGPNFEIVHFNDRSLRYSSVLEATRRAQLQLELHRRDLIRSEILDWFDSNTIL